MLRDGDGAPGEGEVVIGGEKGDQAKSEATNGLGEAEPIETEPAKTEPAKSEPAKTETDRARPGRSCCR